MITENKKIAFTIVELLTVLTIITILIALLVPALATVRRMAKETQQKAQFTTIDLGLTAFKNDNGDYPPSNGTPTDDYTGAQTLAEALVGYDLLGFHPNSVWNETGGGVYTTTQANLKDRVGPYLELATTNIFRLRHDISNDKPGLFNFNITPLEDDTFVLCDVFTIRMISLPSGDIIKAGTPILYYRANTASKLFDPNTNTTPPEDQIYNSKDNLQLILLKSLTVDGSQGKDHPLGDDNIDGEDLYKFDREGGIRDSKITSTPWPHRPDSYILISAGADGLYGTKDDIRNF